MFAWFLEIKHEFYIKQKKYILFVLFVLGLLIILSFLLNAENSVIPIEFSAKSKIEFKSFYKDFLLYIILKNFVKTLLLIVFFFSNIVLILCLVSHQFTTPYNTVYNYSLGNETRNQKYRLLNLGLLQSFFLITSFLFFYKDLSLIALFIIIGFFCCLKVYKKKPIKLALAFKHVQINKYLFILGLINFILTLSIVSYFLVLNFIVFFIFCTFIYGFLYDVFDLLTILIEIYVPTKVLYRWHLAYVNFTHVKFNNGLTWYAVLGFGLINLTIMYCFYNIYFCQRYYTQEYIFFLAFVFLALFLYRFLTKYIYTNFGIIKENPFYLYQKMGFESWMDLFDFLKSDKKGNALTKDGFILFGYNNISAVLLGPYWKYHGHMYLHLDFDAMIRNLQIIICFIFFYKFFALYAPYFVLLVEQKTTTVLLLKYLRIFLLLIFQTIFMLLMFTDLITVSMKHDFIFFLANRFKSATLIRHQQRLVKCHENGIALYIEILLCVLRLILFLLFFFSVLFNNTLLLIISAILTPFYVIFNFFWLYHIIISEFDLEILFDKIFRLAIPDFEKINFNFVVFNPDTQKYERKKLERSKYLLLIKICFSSLFFIVYCFYLPIVIFLFW